MQALHFARHELQGGIFGVLEVKSHSSPADDPDSTLAIQFPVQVSNQDASNDVDDANSTASIRSIEESRPAIEDPKLFEIVRAATVVPKVRKKKKPTRASKERRLATKKHRSEVKKQRRSTSD